MPDRYRGGLPAFLAFGAVVIAILGYFLWTESARLTEQRVRDEQRTEAHIEYAEDRIDQKCLSITDQSALRNCIHQEIEAARDHSRAEGDLDAQQEMAKFTRIMGFTGLFGIAIGVASIGLIFMTLWETAAGVQVMRNEQRPWISVTTNLVAGGPDYDPSVAQWTVRVKNIGHQVARDVRILSEKLDGDSKDWPEKYRNIEARVRTDTPRDAVMFPSESGDWQKSVIDLKSCNGTAARVDFLYCVGYKIDGDVIHITRVHKSYLAFSKDSTTPINLAQRDTIDFRVADLNAIAT